MSITYYRRDGSPAADYSETLGVDEGRVGRTRVGDVEVSTVFLFINHNHSGGGPPILFESMLFCDNEDDARHCSLTRYCTEAEAKAGHDEAVNALREGKALDWMTAL